MIIVSLLSACIGLKLRLSSISSPSVAPLSLGISISDAEVAVGSIACICLHPSTFVLACTSLEKSFSTIQVVSSTSRNSLYFYICDYLYNCRHLRWPFYHHGDTILIYAILKIVFRRMMLWYLSREDPLKYSNLNFGGLTVIPIFVTSFSMVSLGCANTLNCPNAAFCASDLQN